MIRILTGLVAIALLLVPAQAQDQPPPRADAFDSASNFLACSGNSYALCYYSGPKAATPTSGGEAVRPLPCTVQGNNADCTCYAINDGTMGGRHKYNFVEIGSILNPKVRKDAKMECGDDGSGCLNMKSLAACTKSGGKGAGCQMASMCGLLGNVKTGERQKLYPQQSDIALISTFSFAYHDVHQFGSTDCSAEANPAYAGCMTAPCVKSADGLTQCTCPIYKGPYQIGQSFSGIQCDISADNTIWSAAENENEGK